MEKDKHQDKQKDIPETNFDEPLKKPSHFTPKKHVEYKKYLDEHYSEEWMAQYFTLSKN